MISIVVDTNQFLSGFLYHGMIQAVFELVLERKIRLYISQELINEVLEKLQFLGADKQVQQEVLLFLNKRGIIIEPTVKIAVCRDREDNFVLELSEAARAEYLITRDKDLLDIQRWKVTEITKPEEFLPLLRKMKLLS